MRRMVFSSGFNVPSIGKAGGLSLWWDDLVKVGVTFSSKNIIDMRMRQVGKQLSVQVTKVYGTSYHGEKAVFFFVG